MEENTENVTTFGDFVEHVLDKAGLPAANGEAPADDAVPDDPEVVAAAVGAETAALLETIRGYITDYIVFAKPAQAVAVALWVLHTWAFPACEVTPYLLTTAPERESGKSRLSEVCKPVVREGVMTASASPAALYREIEDHRSTLFIDELDNLFGRRGADERASELAAIINSGNNVDGHALRCVGEGSKQRSARFSTFSPKMLSGRDLGKLPGPLVSRCIPIRLQRKAKGDTVKRYRRRLVASSVAEIAEWCQRWAKAAVPMLENAAPELPEALSDRQQDGWEPLLAIGDLAGGGWPELVRAAALELHSASAAAGSTTIGTQLLTDIHAIFDSKAPAGDTFPVLSSQTILSALILLDEKPWPAWWGETDRWGTLQVRSGAAWRLARELEPFQIGPRFHHRPGTKSEGQRGYHRADFELAWERYCPPSAPKEA